jgi:hypothetical protein
MFQLVVVMWFNKQLGTSSQCLRTFLPPLTSSSWRIYEYASLKWPHDRITCHFSMECTPVLLFMLDSFGGPVSPKSLTLNTDSGWGISLKDASAFDRTKIRTNTLSLFLSTVHLYQRPWCNKHKEKGKGSFAYEWQWMDESPHPFIVIHSLLWLISC